MYTENPFKLQCIDIKLNTIVFKYKNRGLEKSHVKTEVGLNIFSWIDV